MIGPAPLRPVYADERYWDLLQKMLNRMAVSEQKYGPIDSNHGPSSQRRSNGRENITARLALYDATGNTEWLIDAANFCLIEAIRPSHPAAHFRATDTDESPGLS